MDDLKIIVDDTKVDPSCVRFIFQSEPYPGGHDYKIILQKNVIDKELLNDASFVSKNEPSENQGRNWLFWLGHIVSRFSNPEDCVGRTWVINKIHSLTENESELIICGECSPWVKTGQ